MRTYTRMNIPRGPGARIFGMLVLAFSLTGKAGGAEGGLSIVVAQPLLPEKVNATGRVYSLVTARIGPRVSGRIAELGCDADGRPLDAGMRVKAGDVLFRLDDTTFRNNRAMAEAALKSARAALDNLLAGTREERLEQLRQDLAALDARVADRRRDRDRFQRLVEQDRTLPARRLEEVVTELAVLEAQRRAAAARLREAETGATPTEIAMARARVGEAEAALKAADDDLRDSVVRAPFDGVITRRFKSVGDYLTSMPPTDVMEIVVADRLEAELRLPEAYLPAVEAGTTQARLNSPLLAEPLVAAVTRVVDEIDPSRGTFALRVAIPAEKRHRLVPGAFITADIALNASARGAVVPLAAVVEENGSAFVYVAANGKMTRRQVRLGDRLTEAVVVRSGLVAGEKVVVGPAEALRDGAALPEVLSSGQPAAAR